MSAVSSRNIQTNIGQLWHLKRVSWFECLLIDVWPSRYCLWFRTGQIFTLLQDTARLEDSIPVVTALAFRVQEEYNKLVQAVNEGADDANLMERTFIVGELLKLAVNLDYADEIGRRKMFQLASE